MFKYNVAIRTVGKAGEKYIKEIESLQSQSIPPNRIVVYIAEGFDLPQRVGCEEYVYVPKGLVHQRAIVPHDNDVPYLLVLDDDVFLPKDSVEKMYEYIVQYSADCIIPDTFPSHEMGLKDKLIAYLSNNVSPRFSDKYAIRIKKSGAFSYNNAPPKGSLLETQCGAGPVFFIKMSSFLSIRYADELWVDSFPPGTFYEDQLMFYKLYVNGCKMLMWFDSGVKHLDAGTNNQKEKSFEKLMYRSMANYVIWHRSVLGTTTGGMGRFVCYVAYFYRFICGLNTRFVYSCVRFSFKYLVAYIKGNLLGMIYVRGDFYKGLNTYVLN